MKNNCIDNIENLTQTIIIIEVQRRVCSVKKLWI